MLCIYDEFSRLQFLSLPRIRWWRFSLALSWGYLSDFMQSGFSSSSSTRSWITKVAGEALLVKTPRAPTSVIGKSQIKYLTGISALSRTGFKSLSQISNPYFSSNPNSFTVKSQIKSQIFRTVTVLTVSVVQLVRCSCGIKSHPKCFFSMIHAFRFALESKQLICRDWNFFQTESPKISIKSQIESRSFEPNLCSSNRIWKYVQIAI